MYQFPNNILKESLSGSAYKTIYQHKYNRHTSDFPLLIVIIIIWIDAIHIDTYGRFKLEPISFTLLIFKEST